jgi:hypothetical protein
MGDVLALPIALIFRPAGSGIPPLLFCTSFAPFLGGIFICLSHYLSLVFCAFSGVRAFVPFTFFFFHRLAVGKKSMQAD